MKADMKAKVERSTEEAFIGMYCVCGDCYPTATAYRDDPEYEWHETRLASGPCCCGRFFAIGTTEEQARDRADALAEDRREKGIAPEKYDYTAQKFTLPWGDEIVAVVADFAE